MIQIDIPIFDGNYLEWERFKDLFTNLVLENTAYTNIETLLILNTKLKGEALLLISDYIKSSQYIQASVILCKQI